jgi:N-acyl homoserine lactone hydrolase
MNQHKPFGSIGTVLASAMVVGCKTGSVLLSGDLYHYPEEMTYKRIPSFDFDMEQTAKSRAMIEEFVKKNNAQLWIQHDYTAGIKRKIAPEFYE